MSYTAQGKPTKTEPHVRDRIQTRRGAAKSTRLNSNSLVEDLIPSGSLVPGIDPDAFGLPPGTALRVERPAEQLRPYFPAYYVMASADGLATPREWMLPSWSMIWINFPSGPLRVEIGNRQYAALASSVMYGVTSRAMPVDATGGVTVGIDVSPLGWARLFNQSAEVLRDRIVPLSDLLPTDFVERLYLELMASDRSLGVKAVLDRLFLPLLATPHREEAEIRKLLTFLENEQSVGLASATQAHGLDARTAGRLARAVCGFPPKMLLTRRRLLCALAPLLDAGEGVRGWPTPAGYYDRSHFHKDAKRYLGMSPQRFLDLQSPYAAAVRRARRAVIGSPLPVLDRSADVGPPLATSCG